MKRTVGVVAIQGDFEKHILAFQAVAPQLEVLEVRTPEDLQGCQRIVLPGGESTTVGILMQRFGLGDAIKAAAADGMPVWGTCMGMIMMAREIEDREQYSLNLLDIKIRRNAFGSQVHSFEDEVKVKGIEEPIMGVFIRAPIVTQMGEGVKSLAEYKGNVVAVQQGNRIGTSFHPDLTDDLALHEWFLTL